MRLFLIGFLAINFICQKSSGAENETLRTLTILATNDLHGSVEPSADKEGKQVGGLAVWSGYVKAIKNGIKSRLGNRGGVIVVDAGDQFQGTLISNYDEGQLVFRSFNQIGYDAVVPGNHDYDFGPVGWLVDKSDNPEKRREALERLGKLAKFPLLSANTFFRNSLRDSSDAPLTVQSRGCRPEKKGVEINWETAKIPEFIKPYLIKEAANVRVALIGIDLANTVNVTTRENVSDLCFGDEWEHYVRIRKQIANEADIFVLVAHHGDAGNEKATTRLVEKLTANAEPLVDAVISGHTHFTYNETVKKVPLIQSGSGGLSFGRIDLVWNTKEKKLDRTATKSYAGVRLYSDKCSPATNFCSVKEGKLLVEGETVVPDKTITSLIADARKAIAPLASRPLGKAKNTLTRDRISENPLANWMTDLFRSITKADVAMMNMGGLRSDIREGNLNYEGFFRVLPFNNHGVVVGPLSLPNLIGLLARSVKTCGAYGALMQSGLKVTFKRNCSKIGTGGIDALAALVSVQTEKNEILFQNGQIASNAPQSFRVATLDFLASGGDGFEAFSQTPLIQDIGIVREVMSDSLSKSDTEFEAHVDGRWENTTP